ncbi:zinc finger HIT domain-containing protein 3 [Bicyclus anynana]|uniref:Zinc finger HIT domain-containing protein 3 n=1 Tax=Bicyclus anynana TaxID=110368 RepID=A0A6J1NH74_BICAN|nr:zinc finger HIT domain-containing protein 3 [Bicyclus anynana]
MSCVQCKGSNSKYKCPTCRAPYCSMVCCKLHKEAPCSPPPPPEPPQVEPKEQPFEYDFPTEDTVSIEKLKLLEESKELNKCLENPHVREILKILDSAPHPDVLINEYMREPIFTEFADACLNVVQNKSEET